MMKTGAVINPSLPPAEGASCSNRKKLIALVVIALAVGLGVGLSWKSDKRQTKPPTFAVNLTTISAETIRQSYASCDALSQDLTQAARHLANRVIESTAQIMADELNFRRYGWGADVDILFPQFYPRRWPWYQ